LSFPNDAKPALLFTGVLINPKLCNTELVFEDLKKSYGEVCLCSRKMEFVWTDYYDSEMGDAIYRYFLVYKGTVKGEDLVKFKKLSDKLENKYMQGSNRVLNIDPGLIAMENLVLSTNKAFFHRVYINEGVYAEVTLYYKNGTYLPMGFWTFPEYRSTPVIDFFNSARGILKELL